VLWCLWLDPESAMGKTKLRSHKDQW
jgi:hypothetical protein